MDSRDSLEVAKMQVERLEAELTLWKELVAKLDRRKAIEAARNLPEGPDTKYANMRPLLAIQSILKEHGKPMPKAELTTLLMKGGIAIGKKRGVLNVNKGIELSVERGTLTSSGKEELIGLNGSKIR